jgi:hypothetical protein
MASLVYGFAKVVSKHARRTNLPHDGKSNQSDVRRHSGRLGAAGNNVFTLVIYDLACRPSTLGRAEQAAELHTTDLLSCCRSVAAAALI